MHQTRHTAGRVPRENSLTRYRKSEETPNLGRIRSVTNLRLGDAHEKKSLPYASLIQRSEVLLDDAAKALFVAAVFLFCFKLFWTLVGEYTLYVLDIILAWPMLGRMIGALIFIAVPVLLAGYFLFGDEERPGWLIVAKLRNHPVIRTSLGLFRRATAVIASFAFFKLIWLTGDEGVDAVDWWDLLRQLMLQF